MRRFWDKVDKRHEGCWEWQAGQSNGYGHFKLDGKQQLAHRVAYTFVYGEICKGMNINHHCDNTLCVRPTHLYQGTQKQNCEDAVRRGRNFKVKGEKHGRAFLSDKQVARIRELHSGGCTTQQSLAALFGVSQSQVSRLILNQSRS